MPKKGRGRGKKSQAKLEPLVCSYCEESFLQTVDFENHIELPHVQCQYCDRFFSSAEKLEGHVGDLHLVTTRDWDCSTCGLSFVTEEEKSNHDKLHYIPEKLPSSQKDCPGPEPLEVEDYDYVKVPEEDLVNVSEGKGFSCSDCGKNHQDLKSLNVHQLKPHGFTCHVFGCTRKFEAKPKLIQHLEGQHGIRHVKIDEQNSGYITTERSQDNVQISEWALDWIK